MPNNLPGKSITYYSGFITIILGIVVVLGWHWHSLFIVQISPDWIPMQYNTAICFVLAGISLITLNKKIVQISRIFSILLLGLSGLTTLEYLLKLNFGIDNLFIQPFVSIVPVNPGRMALNTALSFLFIGMMLWTLSSTNSFNKKKLSLSITLIISSLFLIIVVNLITAFTLHYGISYDMKIAFNTLIGLITLTLGLIGILHQSKSINKKVLIAPLLITFIVLLLTLWCWQSILKSQYDYLNKLLQLKIQSFSTYINIAMQEQANAFARISYRWGSRDGTPEAEWRKDVTHYIQDYPGYTAIEWADKSLFIRWVAPETGNEQVKNFNLRQDSSLWPAIQKAMETKKLEMSRVTSLIQGGRGVIFFSPVFTKGQFDGLMLGVINMKIMMSHLVRAQMVSGYGLKIYNQGQVLYAAPTNDMNNNELYKSWVTKIELPVLGQIWQVELWPSNELFQQIMGSWLQLGSLIIGIFVSLLAGFLTRTSQLLKIGAAKINDIRLELANTNERLNGILEGSNDLIAALDLNLNFIAFNSTYKNEVYRMFKINLEKGMNFNVLLERMSDENRKKTMALWTRALEGQSFTVVESFYDKRFVGLDYEIHYNPIRNAKKELVGASHISTNVSYRIQNQKSLIDSKNALESMVLNLERQNKELGLLEEMMNLLQSSNSVEEVIQPITTYIKLILSSTSGILYFADKKDANSFKEHLHWGNPLAHHSVILKSDCMALSHNRIHQVLRDDDSVDVCKHVVTDLDELEASVCHPLIVHGELLGLFYMEIATEEPISNWVINLARILSEQIGLSLYNIRLREELRVQSTHDILTGLYNRRFFEEYVEKEFLQAERTFSLFSIMLIDIDYFKKINDNYGHLIGDKVLQSVAAELSYNCRKSDVICRWGGEEFLLFLRESTVENIMPKAESIRQAIENMVFDIEGISLSHITISIGVSFYPLDGTDLDTLIAKADEALYLAKKMGRNRVIMSNQESSKDESEKN